MVVCVAPVSTTKPVGRAWPSVTGTKKWPPMLVSRRGLAAAAPACASPCASSTFSIEMRWPLKYAGLPCASASASSAASRASASRARWRCNSSLARLPRTSTSAGMIDRLR